MEARGLSISQAAPRRVGRRIVLRAAVLGPVAALAAACAARPDEGATGVTVDALEAGAVGDGVADDTAALQRALDGLPVGGTLRLARQSVFAVSDVLVVRVRGTRITGGGALLSTDEERSSLKVAGLEGADDVHLEGITLRVVAPTRRWDAYEQQRLHIDGGTGLVLRDVRVEGSAAAGVYLGGGASSFLLDRVAVSATRADGIHLTQGAHDGEVRDPLVTGSGDDGVSVVSYAADGVACHDITIERPVVHGTDVGRGVSVVGGERITYRDVDLRGTGAAAVYIASEGSYDTAATTDVVVSGGRVSLANQDADTDHGAVLIFDGSGRGVRNILVEDVAVVDTRVTASRQVGVLAEGGTATEVRLESISLSGGPSRALEVTGGAMVTTEDWQRDGEPLEDPLAA